MTMTEDALSWPYIAACDMATLYPNLTTGQQQQAINNAVEWMWSHTGRRYGTRPVLYRPQSRGRTQCWGTWPGMYPLGSYIGGYGRDDWSPERDQVLELPGPVVSIETVTINGVVVDPSVWRQEGRFLVRQDGGFWPRTQNMIAALGQQDTWAVNYTRGVVPSPFGQAATGLLICYFAGQLASGKACVMPLNTTRVTRGGVTIDRDPKKGAVTSPVPEVDQWIAMVNPNGLAEEPKVWSPDVDRERWPFAGSYQVTAAPTGVQVSNSPFIILGPTEDPPEGTPVGTLIFRTD